MSYETKVAQLRCGGGAHYWNSDDKTCACGSVSVFNTTPRCADCGTELDSGEAKCFTVCEACWGRHYRALGEEPSARYDTPIWQAIREWANGSTLEAEEEAAQKVDALIASLRSALAAAQADRERINAERLINIANQLERFADGRMHADIPAVRRDAHYLRSLAARAAVTPDRESNP